MAGVTTKTTLRSEIATRADMVTFNTTSFVTLAECDQWIDESHLELYGILVQVYPDLYSAFQDYAVGASGQITPPVTFYKLRGIDKDPGQTYARAIERFNFAERNSVRWLQYRDLGNVIQFYPTTIANGANVRLWFIPTLTLLTSVGADTLDDRCDEYREFIILECAARALEKDKDGETARTLRTRKAEIERRLIEQLPEDIGQPEQVAYCYGDDGRRSWDNGPA